MRGEGGQKEEFRKRMEVGQLIHQTVFTPQIISDIKTFIWEKESYSFHIYYMWRDPFPWGYLNEQLGG